jgi:hypothetical protein
MTFSRSLSPRTLFSWWRSLPNISSSGIGTGSGLFSWGEPSVGPKATSGSSHDHQDHNDKQDQDEQTTTDVHDGSFG